MRRKIVINILWLQVPNTPVASPVSQSGNSTATTTSSTVSPPSSSREAATPVDDKASEPTEKASDSMKKSMLNPNAKEFIFNPNARVFIPVSFVIIFMFNWSNLMYLTSIAYPRNTHTSAITHSTDSAKRSNINASTYGQLRSGRTWTGRSW